MPDCCFTLFVDETSKPTDLCIVCFGVSYYCCRSSSFSAIDHGLSHAHALNRHLEHSANAARRIRTQLDEIDHDAKQHLGCLQRLETSFRRTLPW